MFSQPPYDKYANRSLKRKRHLDDDRFDGAAYQRQCRYWLTPPANAALPLPTPSTPLLLTNAPAPLPTMTKTPTLPSSALILSPISRALAGTKRKHNCLSKNNKHDRLSKIDEEEPEEKDMLPVSKLRCCSHERYGSYKLPVPETRYYDSGLQVDTSKAPTTVNQSLSNEIRRLSGLVTKQGARNKFQQRKLAKSLRRHEVDTMVSQGTEKTHSVTSELLADRYRAEHEEKDALKAEKDALEVEKDALAKANADLNAEHEEKDALMKENDTLKADKDGLTKENDALKADKDTLTKANAHLNAEKNSDTELERLKSAAKSKCGKEQLVCESTAEAAEKTSQRNKLLNEEYKALKIKSKLAEKAEKIKARNAELKSELKEANAKAKEYEALVEETKKGNEAWEKWFYHADGQKNLFPDAVAEVRTPPFDDFQTN